MAPTRRKYHLDGYLINLHVYLYLNKLRQSNISNT